MPVNATQFTRAIATRLAKWLKHPSQYFQLDFEKFEPLPSFVLANLILTKKGQ